MDQKIAIFIHLYQKNHWAQIFEDQIIKLQQSGVYDTADYIHIGVNGDLALPFHLVKVNVYKRNENIDLEADTLVDLHTFCKSNPDYKVLYIHSKGCSHGTNSPYYNNINSWRTYLEHFVIDNWKRCVDLLDSYDTVGTEWEELAWIAGDFIHLPHYAGNFWWARADYISKLDPEYIFTRNEWTRWKGEFWIGTKSPNYYNFYTTDLDKYCARIDPSLYMGI
jgi:hypothetical protein